MTAIHKRMLLVFHGRFPSEKAASLFAAKSAEAFVSEGQETVLVVPRRRNRLEGDPYDFYSVNRSFIIKYLPCIDLYGVPGLSSVAFVLSYLSFSLSFFVYLLFGSSKKHDYVYSNELLPAFFATCVGYDVFYEMHDFPESKIGLFAFMVSRMKGVVVHNTWKAKRFFEICPYWKKPILMERNAVDVKIFSQKVDQIEARKRLGIQYAGSLVVYTGHLYEWKGVDVLAKAAIRFPSSVRAVFVGGTDQDVERFRGLYGSYPGVQIVGHRPHSEISLWQQAATVLVLPNSGKENISKYYTSPMKLFEYMASGRPIIASDLPSITEVLDSSNAFLVEADSPESLNKAILLAVSDRDTSSARASKALEDVQRYSWSNRACRILGYLGVRQVNGCDIVYPNVGR